MPNTDSSLPAPRLQTSDEVHKIGPAAIMGHSFGTQYAVQAGFRDPTEVAGVINLEGTAGHVCNLTPTELASYKTVPQLTVFADHIEGSIYVGGFAQCSARRTVAPLRRSQPRDNRSRGWQSPTTLAFVLPLGAILHLRFFEVCLSPTEDYIHHVEGIMAVAGA